MKQSMVNLEWWLEWLYPMAVDPCSLPIGKKKKKQNLVNVWITNWNKESSKVSMLQNELLSLDHIWANLKHTNDKALNFNYYKK